MQFFTVASALFAAALAAPAPQTSDCPNPAHCGGSPPDPSTYENIDISDFYVRKNNGIQNAGFKLTGKNATDLECSIAPGDGKCREMIYMFGTPAIWWLTVPVLLVTLAAILLFGQAERVRVGRRMQRVQAVAAAVLLGAGLQVKYVVLPEAAGFCLAFLLYWRRHGAGVGEIARLTGGLLLAGLAPTLAVVAFFWSQGALQPFLDATIGSNLAYVADVPTSDETLHRVFIALKPISPAIAGAALALALLGRRVQGGTRAMLHGAAFWLFLSAVNVVLPMKFFAHYFYALLPPACLLAAVLVASLGRPNPRLAFLARAFAVLLLAAPPLRAIAREVAAPADPLLQATELVTACIREHPAGRPGLYVFNWDPVLYETTRTPPPTRYVLPGELAVYADSAGVDPLAEIARILAGRPGHIVVARPSYTPFSPAAFALIDQAVEGYELTCSIPFRVNERRTARALVYRTP